MWLKLATNIVLYFELTSLLFAKKKNEILFIVTLNMFCYVNMTHFYEHKTKLLEHVFQPNHCYMQWMLGYFMCVCFIVYVSLVNVLIKQPSNFS